MKPVKFHLPAAAVLCCLLMRAGSAPAQTWTQTQAPTNFWWSVASSADGTKLVALVGGVPYAKTIYTSEDSGGTWTSNSVPSVEWWSVASSADGTKLIAAASYGGSGIFTSTNSGTTWVSNNIPAYAWFSVASSADGTKLVAPVIIAGIHRILTSTNSGASWVTNGAPISRVSAVASSADGTRLTAVEPDRIWSSTDSGATWTSNNITGSWHGIAASADGGKLVALDATPGGIWTSQATQTPQLNISSSGSNTKLSWLVPSMNFALQQSSDLSSWIDVTNVPALNLTNLHEEVVLPSVSGSSFYRLESR